MKERKETQITNQREKNHPYIQRHLIYYRRHPELKDAC